MYLGYVRSTLERNLALQSICSPSQQQNLEKVQNEAVKFISGGMKSSPIPACEIDSNIEPISLRRETAVVEMIDSSHGSYVEALHCLVPLEALLTPFLFVLNLAFFFAQSSSD